MPRYLQRAGSGQRLQRRNPVFLYASTNKVYGEMVDVAIVEDATRYRYRDYPEGMDEQQPLDFHSPYGCSKGSGDQYVRDYSRIYGLPTVVFRQSCIYRDPPVWRLKTRAGWRGLSSPRCWEGRSPFMEMAKQIRDLLLWKISWMLTTQRLPKRTKLLGMRSISAAVPKM